MRVKQTFSKRHGLVFFPKRSLVRPKVKTSHFPKNTRYALSYLSQFLDWEAVGDKFGADHKTRRIWRSQATKDYGEPFLDLYYYRNQLRVNRLSLVALWVSDLVQSLQESNRDQLAKDLQRVADDLKIKLKNYNELDDLNKKMEVVHFFEDSIIKVLDMLTKQERGRTDYT